MFTKIRSLKLILLLIGIALVGCNNDKNFANTIHLANAVNTFSTAEDQKPCVRKWYGSLDADKRCYKLQELLVNSSSEGDIDSMQKALKQGADIESTFDSSLPALNAAIIEGQLDAVIFLLNNGAMVNTELRFGETPLKDAVYYDKYDIAKLIIDKGSDVCNDSSDWGTAISIAVKKNNQEMIRLLKNAGAENCKK